MSSPQGLDLELLQAHAPANVHRRAADVSRLDWYVAMAYLKLAVVLEGIHFRFTQGKTVGSSAAAASIWRRRR